MSDDRRTTVYLEHVVEYVRAYADELDESAPLVNQLAEDIERDLRAPSPLHEWGPFPSREEVAAHAARTGGDCFGPWLRLRDPDDESCVATVEMLAVYAEGDHDGPPFVDIKGCPDDDDTEGLWRCVSRRLDPMPRPKVTP